MERKFFYFQHDDDTPFYVFTKTPHYPFVANEDWTQDAIDLVGMDDLTRDAWKQLLKDMANGA